MATYNKQEVIDRDLNSREHDKVACWKFTLRETLWQSILNTADMKLCTVSFFIGYTQQIGDDDDSYARVFLRDHRSPDLYWSNNALTMDYMTELVNYLSDELSKSSPGFVCKKRITENKRFGDAMKGECLYLNVEWDPAAL